MGFLKPKASEMPFDAWFFCPTIIYDKDKALYAVGEEDENLEYVAKELRGDKGVALDAVGNNGRALKYASERLKANRNVVKLAVGQNGRTLRFAPIELWSDPELIDIGNQTYRQRKKKRQ